MTAPSDRRLAAVLCWTAVLLDGYDLVVLGTVIPVLLRDKVWGLTPAGATAIATAGLAGMAIGALAIGTLTDYFGRRRVLIFSVTMFSVFMLACAAATSIGMLGTFRFLAGLGLGGCLPTAITLATEFSRPGRAAGATTRVMTGYHVGAILTAVLGLLVMGRGGHGWPWMFVIGGLPGLIAAPLMWRYLPESREFKAPVKNPVGSLFAGGMARPTVAFWLTSFFGLILVYGLNTWLPNLMIVAGYPLEQGLGLLLTLNLGAIGGLLVAGRVADRAGVRPATLGWFGLAAVFLALLSIKMPAAPLYAAVFVTGAFVFSAQALVYAYVGLVYDAGNRATGLGWTAGVGRIGAIVGPIIIGALLTADSGYPWGFYVFALVAALGMACAAVVGPTRAAVDPVVPSPARP
ncbi:aromatic acid/H+ symport family MFS transporter [Actinoplanes sp. NPDC051470]|uniref:MFS transporter n=1 Tax=unclassified Actinoplanes TaxID=2626549 RepID=UPI00341C75F2